MPYCQVVVGPPGSGKSTYCDGMQQFLQATGRPTIVVNLDPANGHPPYESAIDLRDLVDLDVVMKELQLGPNGGLIYCMEYLEANLDWLHEQLQRFPNTYVLFDMPGQVELFTNHSSVVRLIEQLTSWDFRPVAVHLVDSHHCADPAKFISVLLLSLSTMLHLELPHINVLSKLDLIESGGRLPANLDFYTDVLSTDRLLDMLQENGTHSARYARLNAALCRLIDDFALVQFATLNIQDKESVFDVVKLADKCNGYVYGLLGEDKEMRDAIDREAAEHYNVTQRARDRYMSDTVATVRPEDVA